jgi:TetR/AcrR family transcriptional repressor of nem operon
MEGDTAAQIVEVANGLMIERGYAAFSYADISERIAITKAGIHHHFPAKAGLAVAVLKRHREKFEQSTRYLDSKVSDPLSRLQAYVQYWENCIRDRTVSICVAALMSAELPSLPEAVQAEVHLYFASLGTWLEKTLQAGVDSHVIDIIETPANEAQVLMAAVHGAMLSARVSGSSDVFHLVATSALNRLCASTTAPPPQ